MRRAGKRTNRKWMKLVSVLLALVLTVGSYTPVTVRAEETGKTVSEAGSEVSEAGSGSAVSETGSETAPGTGDDAAGTDRTTPDAPDTGEKDSETGKDDAQKPVDGDENAGTGDVAADPVSGENETDTGENGSETNSGSEEPLTDENGDESGDVDDREEGEEITFPEEKMLAPGEEVDKEPKKSWGDEDWTKYRAAVAEALEGKDQVGYYLNLDDEALTAERGYKVYYMTTTRGGTAYNSNHTFEQAASYNIKLQMLEGFPGLYVLNLGDVLSTETYTNIYIYKADETIISKPIYTVSVTHSELEAGKLYKTDTHYSISFKQGDIEVKDLPETFYRSSGYSVQHDPENINTDLDYYEYKYDDSSFLNGAYAFSHWEDDDQNEYTAISDVNKKLVLHPVLVNIQDLPSYGSGTFKNHLKQKIEKKTVTTASELLENITTLSEVDRKILLIQGEIVLDKTALQSLLDAHGGSVDGVGAGDDRPGFAWCRNMIVVTDGASLTFDGIRVNTRGGSGGISDELYDRFCQLVVQSGGTLTLRGPRAKGLFSSYDSYGFIISLQKDANMIVEDFACEATQIRNYGTIKIVEPENADKDSKNYKDGVDYPFIKTYSSIYNATGARMESEYGIYRVDNEQYSLKGYSPNVNRGTIRLTKNGGFHMPGSSSQSSGGNTDRSSLVPFINEGTIECATAPIEDFYGSTLQIEYSRLLNRGTIRVAQEEHTPPEWTGETFASWVDTAVGGFTVYESVVTNEGTIDVTAGYSVGISLQTQSPFLDPDKYGQYYKNPPAGIVYPGIDNYGTISLASTKDSAAMAVGTQCILHNFGAGTVMVENTDTGVVLNNVSLCAGGTILNEGIITNNGGIGFWYGSYSDLLAYTGNPWQGSGQEYYRVYFTISDGGSSDTKVTVKSGNEVLAERKNGRSLYGFLPKGGTYDLTASAAGFNDVTVSIAMASGLEEYKTDSDSHSVEFAFVSDGSPQKPAEKDYYKVTFNSNGGTYIAPQTVSKDGGKARKPQTDPTKSGYQFDGWYADPEFQTKWNFDSDRVTEDITLYAKWIRNAAQDESPEDIEDKHYVYEEETRIDIGRATVGAIKNKVYDGKPYLPAVKVTMMVNGKNVTLTEGTDYRVIYQKNVDAGEGKAVIKGNGLYKGFKEATFQITKKPIGKLKAVAGSMLKGSSGLPQINVYDGSVLLAQGTDYRLVIPAELTKKKGNKKVTVSAIEGGNYSGSLSVTVSIIEPGKNTTMLTPDNTDITLEYDTTAYTGSQCKPAVTVKYNGTALEKKHYSVKYTNNTNAGMAYVTVKGKSGYCGSVVRTFEIMQPTTDFKLKKDIAAMKYTYNGKLVKPKVTVQAGVKNAAGVDKTKTLKAGKDYIITYRNNLHANNTAASDAGRSAVIIKGIGNYAGIRREFYFTIQPQQIKKAAVKGAKDALILTYAKRTLQPGTDYDKAVVYGEEKNKKVPVTIKGLGDFTGEVTKSVKVQ